MPPVLKLRRINNYSGEKPEKRRLFLFSSPLKNGEKTHCLPDMIQMGACKVMPHMRAGWNNLKDTLSLFTILREKAGKIWRKKGLRLRSFGFFTIRPKSLLYVYIGYFL